MATTFPAPRFWTLNPHLAIRSRSIRWTFLAAVLVVALYYMSWLVGWGFMPCVGLSMTPTIPKWGIVHFVPARGNIQAGDIVMLSREYTPDGSDRSWISPYFKRVVKVEGNKCFLLGDNDESEDSRDWGWVPNDKIKAKVPSWRSIHHPLWERQSGRWRLIHFRYPNRTLTRVGKCYLTIIGDESAYSILDENGVVKGKISLNRDEGRFYAGSPDGRTAVALEPGKMRLYTPSKTNPFVLEHSRDIQGFPWGSMSGGRIQFYRRTQVEFVWYEYNTSTGKEVLTGRAKRKLVREGNRIFYQGRPVEVVVNGGQGNDLYIIASHLSDFQAGQKVQMEGEPLYTVTKVGWAGEDIKVTLDRRPPIRQGERVSFYDPAD